MNTENINKLADYVEANDAHFNMWSLSECIYAFACRLLDIAIFVPSIEPDGATTNNMDTVKKFLDVSEEQAQALFFFPKNEEGRELSYENINRHQAADALRHLARTGKVAFLSVPHAVR